MKSAQQICNKLFTFIRKESLQNTSSKYLIFFLFRCSSHLKQQSTTTPKYLVDIALVTALSLILISKFCGMESLYLPKVTIFDILFKITSKPTSIKPIINSISNLPVNSHLRSCQLSPSDGIAESSAKEQVFNSLSKIYV